MCGFVGLAFSGNAAMRGRLRPALDTLLHRGPDGKGTWADEHTWLGHCRLAIIDLNARSDQPMVDEETGHVLVFNGEIYNYRELRSELEAVGCRFRTSSDTEVLLKAYRHWGPSAFERMNGMWSVAIWHPRERRLFLCRDRFGVKPLYYARLAGALAFASEPKALLAIAPELAEPNPDAIARLVISSKSLAGEDTYFHGIRSVPPASWTMIEDSGAIEFRRFWHYPEAEGAAPRGPGEEQEEFDALLESAVSLRLRSDVPVGLTLSGGLDSTAILATRAMGDHGKITAFTATFPGHVDEFSWAESAAARTGVELLAVDSSSHDWIGNLRNIVWHMDAPGYSPAVFPLWNIMARARTEGVPVLLEGQGADELLGGYVQYAAAHLWKQCRGSQMISAFADFPKVSGTFGFLHLVKWMARLMAAEEYRLWQSRQGRGAILVHRPDDNRDLAGPSLLDPYEMMRTDHSSAVLPSLLHYGDAVSMAHGIESRLPFLDYRLVEWVFRKRPLLFERGATKSPLRSFLASRKYHAHAQRRDKKGFNTPTQSWIFDSSDWIKDALVENPSAELWQYIRRDRAKKMLEPNDSFSASHAYKLVTLQLWLDNLKKSRSSQQDGSRHLEIARLHS